MDGDLPFPAGRANDGSVPDHVMAEGRLTRAGKPEPNGKGGRSSGIDKLKGATLIGII